MKPDRRDHIIRNELASRQGLPVKPAIVFDDGFAALDVRLAASGEGASPVRPLLMTALAG
jgi:hypothetical protein